MVAASPAAQHLLGLAGASRVLSALNDMVGTLQCHAGTDKLLCLKTLRLQD